MSCFNSGIMLTWHHLVTNGSPPYASIPIIAQLSQYWHVLLEITSCMSWPTYDNEFFRCQNFTSSILYLFVTLMDEALWFFYQSLETSLILRAFLYSLNLQTWWVCFVHMMLVCLNSLLVGKFWIVGVNPLPEMLLLILTFTQVTF